MEILFGQLLLAPFAVMIAWVVDEVVEEYKRHDDF